MYVVYPALSEARGFLGPEAIESELIEAVCLDDLLVE